MTLVDKSSGPTGNYKLLGDVIVVISCVVYAGYTVAIKKLLPENGSFDFLIFFGYMGLFTATVAGCSILLLQGLKVVNISVSSNFLEITILKGNLFSIDYAGAHPTSCFPLCPAFRHSIGA